MAQMKFNKREFITITSIANYCMVNPTTVRRWIKDGKLHAIKLPGGHFRVIVHDFKDFLKRNNMPYDNSLQN